MVILVLTCPGSTWSISYHSGGNDAKLMPSLFFPTCQVRVSRFYQSYFLLLVLLLLLRQCRTSTTSAWSQWAMPDLNRELQSAVGLAGPQALPDLGRSLPDLHHERQIAASTAGLNRECECKMSDRMTESHKECQKRCHIDCRKKCQIECLIECQRECQIEWQNICAVIFCCGVSGMIAFSFSSGTWRILHVVDVVAFICLEVLWEHGGICHFAGKSAIKFAVCGRLNMISERMPWCVT